ncbi:MAG TPA: hypothetical protein P5120_11670 [Spirochaetota bacterium]|nr:hypothetical protein [Spirochaetota bacterium]HPF06832.1 hypothetical protein [Spirochaetota bacterium]HPJ43267.1 hypothetical protein [Spirochaetota bacterium]HPR38009.1 hypothetical protein [Spirochaetota bacterium]HRX48168.1 hypothetical protein [Spirochaetota bacterium]
MKSIFDLISKSKGLQPLAFTAHCWNFVVLEWGTGVITPVKPPAGAHCDAIDIIKTMFLLYLPKIV